MSSRRNVVTVKEEDLTRLEGLIQDLAGTDAKYRPKTWAHIYIAQNLGIKSRTVQGWIRKAQKVAHYHETSQRFFELYMKIANLLSEQMAATVFRMAEDPGNRNALASAKWLLPKIAPHLYGDSADAEEDDEVSLAVADVPQEVFDNMTDREIDEIDKLSQVIADAMEASAIIVQKVQQRVLAARVDSGRSLH